MSAHSTTHVRAHTPDLCDRIRALCFGVEVSPFPAVQFCIHVAEETLFNGSPRKPGGRLLRDPAVRAWQEAHCAPGAHRLCSRLWTPQLQES